MLRMLARPCGQVVVVDEDVMLDAQLGDGNLLIVPGTTDGVLEVEDGYSALVSARNCSIVWMELSTEPDRSCKPPIGPSPSRGSPLYDVW